MSIKDEIKQVYKDRIGRNVDPEKNMGFAAINAQAGAKSARLTDPNHGELTNTKKRWLASYEDFKDPKNAYLYPPNITHCKRCGKELTFSQITSGVRICGTCSAVVVKEKHTAEVMEAIDSQHNRAVSSQYDLTSIVDDNSLSVVRAPQKMLSEEEQKAFVNSMCRISTLQDVVEHAPDRAIVMVHIENFSPVINNYYVDKNEQKQ